MKKIAILGSTGNVGTQTLEVIERHPEKFKVIALSAHNNITLLKDQAKRFKPLVLGVTDEAAARDLQSQTKIPVLAGPGAIMEIAKMGEYDTLINALVGLVGIHATLTAIENKKNVALANKEALVAAGEIVMKKAREFSVTVMPIDSEHSALFQCLNGERREDVHRLILTCSGGALRDKNINEIANASVKEALGHKTWSMGRKITTDSATLMNKGFEVIEAMHLYDMPVDRLSVIIHPESIIHSMIEYSDGSIIAQMSNPDMKLPIQYALSYPERWDAPIERFNFEKNLTFSEPDLDRFPCLAYAFQAAKEMGTLPAVMNAANDFMVENFLSCKCRLGDIPRIIRKVMDVHNNIKRPTLMDIENAIRESQQLAEKFLRS